MFYGTPIGTAIKLHLMETGELAHTEEELQALREKVNKQQDELCNHSLLPIEDREESKNLMKRLSKP